MELPPQGKAPWQQGYDAGLAGKPGPAFPTPDSSWATRLYAAGWSRGTDDRVKNRE
jgi:ribosome modulation factor